MNVERAELNLEPEQKFVLDVQDEESLDLQFSETDEESFVLQFGEVVNNSTNDFNRLYNRPSYAGKTMTGNTDIPEVIEYQAGENITIEGNVISAKSTEIEIDDKMSPTSTNPVENRVIYAVTSNKVDSDELATVAFTGEYEDLKNEPTGFSPEDWELLWATY